jgi:hypothetical protein
VRTVGGFLPQGCARREAIAPCPLQVKLKDVVDYVADVIGYNAATSVADGLVQPAVDVAVTQLIGDHRPPCICCPLLFLCVEVMA